MTDRYLQKLWRDAVLKKYNNRCFFCGARADVVEVECHHTVKRRVLLTRHDWRCGIPACKYANQYNTKFKGMSCHTYAETPGGRALIAKKQKKYLEHLTDRARPAKQWLVEHGMTEKEYMQIMCDELKEILGG